MQKQRVFGYAFVHGLLIILSAVGLAFACAAYSESNSITSAASSHGRFAANASVPELVQSAERFPTGTAPNSAVEEAIIIDHSTTDITAIPQQWIEEAKRTLHIGYGHTSHGSQLATGMAGLVSFANDGGLGLSLPADIFQFSPSGNFGGDYLHLFEGAGGGTGDLDYDCGYYPHWVDETLAYLGAPDPVTGRGTNHPEMNVIIWSWCGQVSSRTEQQMLDTYLLPMSQLEVDYPGVTFVYMTGHTDGTGEDGNLHLRNQQIRDYCTQNGKVLYDFYDVELYDPDGEYYGDKAVTDNCDYDSDGNGTRDRNWAIDWQNVHTEGTDWYGCTCLHSQALNCNQKAYAAWWLWARLAGWDGGTQAGPQKTTSTEAAVHGQTVTYTVVIRDTGAPLTATIYMTDTVPSGLSYIPGSIIATAGYVTDTHAPSLYWSGVLTPTPAVTITYAVTVSASTPQTIINRAVIAAPGYQTITRTATVNVMVSPSYPDLSPSYKAVSSPYAELGERVTYAVAIRNSTGPLSQTVLFTDVVPTGMVYVPGSLTATTGAADDTTAPTLTWSGVLTPTPVATVTYAVTVSASTPQAITNRAVIATPGYQTVTRTATVNVMVSPSYPDLSPSYKAVSSPYAELGERVTYAVAIRNSTGPLSQTVLFTDVVPTGMVYVPGSLTATTGAADDTTAPMLTWSGTLTPTPAVTITYVAAVTYTIPGSTAIFPSVIANTALIAVPGYQTITRTTTVTIALPPGYPDLSPCFKAASPEYAGHGEHVTYTVGIRNSTGPLSQTVLFTDTVPAGMAYVVGTLTATAGTASDTAAPMLTWSGTLTPTPAVTITYVAAVTYTVPGSTAILPNVIANMAFIAVPGYQTITRTAAVIANPHRLYLPVLLRYD